MQSITHEVDEAGRRLLVTDEKKALAGLGRPSDVALGDIGRLLGALVGGERLGLVSLVAEEEEFLAGDEVPVERSRVSENEMSCHSQANEGLPTRLVTYLGKLRPWALWPS